ncbi:leucine-rich repeat protein [Lachnospiraceae bacterium MD329]|nr:leucine-rich repeat protein [Lachnospiraceae bacterium MD329]
MKKHMYICLLVSLIMMLLCGQTALAEFKNTELINGGIQYFYHPETKSMEIYQTRSGHGETYLYAESPFKDCGVEKAAIGDGVLKIGHNLFRDCKTLKSVTIGNDTTYLNQTIFKGCTALKDVTLGNGLTEFVYATFQDCRSLTNISLPDSLIKMESCSSTSEVYKALKDCLLRRNGVIIGGNRAFLDFRCEEVRNYTMDAVDCLYSMGVRYIKNDYNHNLCIGCDGADSLSQGLAEHRAEFLRFIEQVKKKYPDMIIESCSSGAMRADYGFIKYMDLQSVSDHEIYYNNPSIMRNFTIKHMMNFRKRQVIS